MAEELSGRQGGALGAVSQLPTLMLLLAGPPLVALWCVGVRELISRTVSEHRWLLGIAVVVVLSPPRAATALRSVDPEPMEPTGGRSSSTR